MSSGSVSASSSTPSPVSAQAPSISQKRSSTASMRGRSDSARLSIVSRTSSSHSIPFTDEDVEVVIEEGLRHTDRRLHARRYKSTEFAQAVLDIILELKVSSWTSLGDLCAENIRVEKVAGSLTNAVFFVSYIGMPSAKTVLLRIYGPSSSELISRPRELHTLHVLSSIYRIGPRVYGTFENGRLEEFFESSALTASELRDPTLSAWIGARMAELHCVDIDAIEGDSGLSKQGCRGAWDIDAKKNFLAWLGPARKVLKLASVSAAFKRELAFDEFVEEWKRYMLWLEEWERQHGASKRVFSHNDAQYGNLLRRKEVKEGTPDHRQIIVVDFEYAGPNPAAFDIANHFHEWTANYHDPEKAHILDPSLYPSERDRANFYRSYLEHACLPLTTTPVPPATANGDAHMPQSSLLNVTEEAKRLEAQVKVWSPSSHAMWAVWGLVQAREDLELAAKAEAEGSQPERLEFDYLGYTLSRVAGFRREMQALGI